MAARAILRGPFCFDASRNTATDQPYGRTCRALTLLDTHPLRLHSYGTARQVPSDNVDVFHSPSVARAIRG